MNGDEVLRMRSLVMTEEIEKQWGCQHSRTRLGCRGCEVCWVLRLGYDATKVLSKMRERERISSWCLS
jgi:hypothetical protein